MQQISIKPSLKGEFVKLTQIRVVHGVDIIYLGSEMFLGGFIIINILVFLAFANAKK